MTIIRRNLFSFSVLLILPIILLLPALLPGKALLPAAMLGRMLPWKELPAFPANGLWNPLQFDGIAQFYPWRLFAAHSLRSGFIPLWNPYQFCGTPFLANDQSATLYPLNLIYAVMPVAYAFGVSAVLHLFLAGVFLFLFLRRHVSPPAALLGGVIWQLSTWQIGWLALPTFLCTSTWIPLVLLLIERCAEKPRPSCGVALGLALGVMLLAGHLQIAFYGLLICVAYGVTLLAAETQRNDRLKLAGAFLLAGLLMVLISAPQMLPTLELARVSHRVGAQATMDSYQGYVAGAMPWYRLVTLFAPSFFGGTADFWDGTRVPYSETACFVGVGTLLLAWAAVTALGGRKNPPDSRRRVLFFGIAALASLLIAVGTPLNMPIYFGIPGFGQSGSPARILVLWSISLAVLAAYGLDVIRERGLPRPALWLALASTILPLGATVLLMESRNADLLKQIDRPDLLASIALLGAAIAIVSYMGAGVKGEGKKVSAPSRRMRAGTAALLALTAVDLLRAGYALNPSADIGQVYPSAPVIRWLQEHAAGSRIVAINGPSGVYEEPGVLPPNAATVYGLYDLQGYDSLQTGQYLAFLDRLNGGLHSRPQENGNMALTHYPAAESIGGMQEVAAHWIVSPVALMGLGAPVVSDETLSVYAEPGIAASRARTVTSPLGQMEEPPAVLVDMPTRMVVRTNAPGNLVIADQWYPGWRARLNGRDTPIDEAPDVFRTVSDVPAGSTVEFTYKPTSFLLGLYLLGAGLLAAGALLGSAIGRKASTG